MLFPNQIFANAAKLLFGLSLFRKLLRRTRPEAKQTDLPEYLNYPNLAPLAENFQPAENDERIHDTEKTGE